MSGYVERLRNKLQNDVAAEYIQGWDNLMTPFSLNGKQRNLLLIITEILIVVMLIVALYAGHRQDQLFKANYQRYQQAVDLMGEKQYSLALQNFDNLDADSKAGYQVLYMSAFCELQTGDYSAALLRMQMAREARPALVQDQKFLFRYGLVLFDLGNYEQSALYLNESLKYPNDAGTLQDANKYLAEIDKKTRGR